MLAGNQKAKTQKIYIYAHAYLHTYILARWGSDFSKNSKVLKDWKMLWNVPD